MRKNEPVNNIMSNNITTVQEGQRLSEVRHKMVGSDLIRYLSKQY